MKLPLLGDLGEKLGGKKAAEDTGGRGYVPTDRTLELMGKGFSEVDTIDALRREGFSPMEIDSALEQSIKQGAVGPRPQRQMLRPPADQQQPFQRLGETYENFEQNPSPTFPPRKQEPAPQPEKGGEPAFDLPTIEDFDSKSKVDALAVPETSLPEEYYQSYPTEEYIDYVVQEHMGDLNRKLNEFSALYKELDSRVAELNERLKDTTRVKSDSQQQVISRIDSLNDSINEMNMRVGGVEKAFKDTLPALIESVRALSDIVQRMKREA